MSVRDTLELDLTPALAGVAQLDRALSTAASRFETNLNTATVGLGKAAEAGTGSVAGLNKTLDENTLAATRAAQASTNHASALHAAGTAAGIAGLAIAGGIGLAIKSSIDFEKSLSTVAAVSDATAGELDKLRVAAIDAGKATVFSAKDAADAEAELAKAGISTSDILGGALRGSLDLASAGQLDLATAATISAQAMQIFGLRGTDVSHIADVLAAGANKSTASVASLGDGLGAVGGAARLAGLTLEETVGALALLDQNSVRGAEGGTALKSALLALFTPTKQQTEALQQYNIQIFDSQGKFVGLAGLAGQLQRAFQGVDDASRNAALGIIFGNFGIQAATALYKEGEDGVRKYTTAVNDQGAASRFAATQMDNLAGDLEQLRGSIETALIQGGSQATSALRLLAQGATAAVNGIADLPPATQGALLGIGGLTSAGLLGFSVFTKLSAQVEKVSEALLKGGPAAQFFGNNLGTIARGVAGVTTLIAVAPGLAQVTGSFDSAGAAAGALGGAMLGLGPLGILAGGAIGTLVGHLGILGNQAALTAQQVAKVGTEIDGLGAKAGATKFLDEFRVGWANASEQVRIYESRIQSLASTNPAAAQKVVDGLDAMGKASGLTRTQIDALREAVDKGSEANVRHAKHVAEAQAANAALTGQLPSVAAAVDNVTTAVDESDKAYQDFVATLTKNVPTSLSLFEQSTKGIEDFQTNGAAALEKLRQNFEQNIQDTINFTGNLKFFMEEGLTNLVQTLATLGPQAAGQIAAAYRNATPETRAAADAQIQQAKEASEGLTAFLANDFGPRLYGQSVYAGTGVGQGLKDGINAQAPEVLAAATAIGQAISGALASSLEISSPSKVTQRLGTYVAQGLAVGMTAGASQYVTPAAASLGHAAVPTISGIPVRGGDGGSAGGGGGPVVIQVAVNGVTDPGVGRAVGREIVAGASDALAQRGIATLVRMASGPG